MKNTKDKMAMTTNKFFKDIPDDILEKSIPTMQTHNDRPEFKEETEENIKNKIR